MSLRLENVSYIYEKGTSQETAAIKDKIGRASGRERE